MEKVTWNEIKSLASDFKRAQQSSTVNKLSERNCIDIINYLTSNNYIQLHFTNDGKSFLTPDELVKEIYEELEVQSDRVSISKLCSSIDIDSYTVEHCISKILINDDNLQLVNNNLINSTYIRKIAIQINDLVKEKGRTDVLELTDKFDLPKMFIDKLVQNNISTIIDAQKEGDNVFTNAFVRRQKAIMCGYLTRCTKPVSLSLFVNKSNFPEKLIRRIVLEMIKSKRIDGSIDQDKLNFVPTVYFQNQKTYVKRFFNQNGFIDFSTLRDVGIVNFTKFIESELSDFVQLTNCALGSGIMSQLEEAIHEVSRNESCCDCYQLLPVAVNGLDLQSLVKQIKYDTEHIKLLECGFVISKGFLEKCVMNFDDIMKKKAEEFVKINRKSMGTIFTEESFKDTFEEGSDKITAKLNRPLKVKVGGGERGRELKNKAVKNKYMSDKKKKSHNSENDSISIDFLTESEAVEIMGSKFENENYPEDFFVEIYSLIEAQLLTKYKSECQTMIVQTSDTAKNKADHQKLENTVSTIFNKIKVFEKGLLEISEPELQKELSKFHLKTVCSELANCLFEFIAEENNLKWDANNVNDSRNKIANAVKGDLSNLTKDLNKTIKDSASFTDFFRATEAVCEAIGILLKKMDKKLEKRIGQELGAQYQLMIQEKQEKEEQMDPAELLLITILLLFHRIVGVPVHASGKFVPLLLPFLQKKAPDAADWMVLKQYQDFVVTLIKLQTSTAEIREQLKVDNQDLQNKVIHIALNWKKQS